MNSRALSACFQTAQNYQTLSHLKAWKFCQSLMIPNNSAAGGAQKVVALRLVGAKTDIANGHLHKSRRAMPDRRNIARPEEQEPPPCRTPPPPLEPIIQNFLISPTSMIDFPCEIWGKSHPLKCVKTLCSAIEIPRTHWNWPPFVPDLPDEWKINFQSASQDRNDLPMLNHRLRDSQGELKITSFEDYFRPP